MFLGSQIVSASSQNYMTGQTVLYSKNNSQYFASGTGLNVIDVVRCNNKSRANRATLVMTEDESAQTLY